jgi:hypothetical protein
MVPIVAVAAILITNQTQAQTRQHLLRGLSKIELLVERLTHEEECGLTEEAIRAAAMYPLSSTKIALDHLADVTFYINILTAYLQEDQLCFSNLSIRAYTYQKVTLEFSGDDKAVVIDLWDSGDVAYSSRNRHARQISEMIEDRVKKFVTDWNLDNKPEASLGTPWDDYKTGPKKSQAPAEEATISLGTAFAVTPSGDLVTN